MNNRLIELRNEVAAIEAVERQQALRLEQEQLAEINSQWVELFSYHWSRFYRNQPRPTVTEMVALYKSGLTPKEATEKMYYDRKGTSIECRPNHGYSGAKAH